MLAGLDAIDWSTLSHAYGSAEDVPDQIRALASGDPDAFDDALSELYGAIFHQGSVYSATAPAVPFLIEMLAVEQTTGKGDLLLFLAHLGGTRSRLDEAPLTAQENAHAEPAAARRLRERAYIEAICAAVSAGAALYARLADDSDPDVAVAALAALSTCAALRDLAPFARVHRRFRDAGDVDRAALALLAAARVAGPDEAGLFEAALAGPEVMALAAALAWVHAASASDGGAVSASAGGSVSGAAVPPAAFEALARRLEAPGAYLGLVRALGGVGEALPGPDDLLRRLSVERRALLLEPLGRVLRALDDGSAALHLAKLLLETAFPRPLPPASRLPEALDDAQRAVLANIVESDGAWVYNGNLHSALQGRTGLDVRDRDAFRELLGVPEPVEVVLVTPQKLPAAAARCRALGRDAWLTAPWVFFRGDTSALDEEIPEDPADFPEEVMDAAGTIAGLLYQRLVAAAAPRASKWRFYPHHGADALRAICERRGWPIRDTPVLAEDAAADDEGDEDEDDEAGHDEEAPAGGSPAITWEELSDPQRSILAAFVARLDGAGWAESRRWHEAFQSMESISVTPVGLGRHSGVRANLEVALWFFDEWLAAEAGVRAGDPYVKLLIGSKDLERRVTFRLYFGERLDEVLGVILAHQAAVDVDNFAQAFVRDALRVTDRLALDLGDGRLLQLGVQQDEGAG